MVWYHALFLSTKRQSKDKNEKVSAASLQLCVIIDWDYDVTIFCHWSSEQGAVFLDQVVQGPSPPPLDKIQKNSNFFRGTFPKIYT